jgi:hypothetical protein
MRAYDSRPRKNVVEWCLGSSGLGQKSPIKFQHSQESAELTGGLMKGAVVVVVVVVIVAVVVAAVFLLLFAATDFPFCEKCVN